MHRTIVVIVAIVALAGVVAVYIWSSHNRYYLVTTSGRAVGGMQFPGATYEIDKKTGQTWHLSGSSKTPIADPQPARPLEDIPASDVARLSGRAGYSYASSFQGNIYNHTAWEIREIRIRVYGSPQAGWDRVFSDTVHISPLSSGSFRFDTVDGHTAGATNWILVSARGYRK